METTRLGVGIREQLNSDPIYITPFNEKEELELKEKYKCLLEPASFEYNLEKYNKLKYKSYESMSVKMLEDILYEFTKK